MSFEELFLENIDELINDENKVVTYKSLSYNLKVHCNVAKQMLYAFLTQERNKKGTDSLSATYFISGVTKPDDAGQQVFKCVVTSEEKLEDWKNLLSVVTSCHLYSIQKSKLKDTNSLYMTDCEKLKENVFDCNKYSSIHYERAKPRSADEMDLLMVNIPVSESDKRSSGSAGSGGKLQNSVHNGPDKTQKKKGPQSAIANMFAKVDNSKKQAMAKTEKEGKSEAESKETSKGTTKGKKAGGGMMGFLTKQNESKTAKTEEKKEAVVHKTTPSPASSKKSQRQEDSDDEDIFRSKKRRRTRQDIFESSSDGEDIEMEPEPENPVPVKEPSPEPEIIEDEEPVPKQPSPAKESEKSPSTKAGDAGQKRRRRKRKLVPKTYLDKDGFMVTEKVWESDSTDASEVEELVKKPAAKVPTPEKNKKGSPKKKTSPGKKGQQGSGKQTSLMSFFKKT